MADRLPKLLAALAVLTGFGGLLLGLSIFVEAWQASQAWAGSGHSVQADLPSDQSPVWLDASPPGIDVPVPVDAVVTSPTLPAPIPAPPLPASPTLPVTGGSFPPTSSPAVAAPVSRQDEADPNLPARAARDAPPPREVAASDIELTEADFRFLDPPEPGAHARLAVTLQNRSDLLTGPITLVLSARWLQAFSVFGAVPAVLDDRAVGDAERRFTFPGLAANERQTVELHLLATADEVDAPEVRVMLGEGDLGQANDEVGKAQPRTVAPRPRPGPARAISVPKLGVRASVVPVAWEPPPFVIGQLQGSAAVSEGNTVLIGHLAGPQGDVFARLGQLRPGDEVTAVSRGLEYRFVVSEIAVRPYTDLSPTEGTVTPRLTLMTCTGQWNVSRQDYSHRIWVVAEPHELALQTIQANAARAAEAAREAEAAVPARATHEAEVAGQTANPAQASPSASSEATGLPTLADDPAALAPVLGPEAKADSERPAPGILMDDPLERAQVAQRVTVRGRRTSDADPQAPLWLLVRADVGGSRWYALAAPLDVREDGSWQAELQLGGAAGIHHEIRVGPADARTDEQLRRHASERPGQPLDELPEGFMTGARVMVERR